MHCLQTKQYCWTLYPLEKPLLLLLLLLLIVCHKLYLALFSSHSTLPVLTSFFSLLLLYHTPRCSEQVIPSTSTHGPFLPLLPIPSLFNFHTCIHTHVFCLAKIDFHSFSFHHISPPPQYFLPPAPHSHYRSQYHLETLFSMEIPV